MRSLLLGTELYSKNFILISNLIMACVFDEEATPEIFKDISLPKKPSKAGRPVHSYDDIKSFIESYPDCSISDIMKNTGYCRSTVSHVLNECGFKIQKCKTGPRIGNKTLEIISFINNHPDYSYGQIANIFKCTRQYIYYLKKRSDNL